MQYWILSGTILALAVVASAEDSPATYEGRSANADWRTEANARITAGADAVVNAKSNTEVAYFERVSVHRVSCR
jgi:hypothetical protein